MDTHSPKSSLEVIKRHVRDAIEKAHAFLQTPFGATAGGGLVVALTAKLLFG